MSVGLYERRIPRYRWFGHSGGKRAADGIVLKSPLIGVLSNAGLLMLSLFWLSLFQVSSMKESTANVEGFCTAIHWVASPKVKKVLS